MVTLKTKTSPLPKLALVRPLVTLVRIFDCIAFISEIPGQDGTVATQGLTSDCMADKKVSVEHDPHG